MFSSSSRVPIQMDVCKGIVEYLSDKKYQEKDEKQTNSSLVMSDFFEAQEVFHDMNEV